MNNVKANKLNKVALNEAGNKILKSVVYVLINMFWSLCLSSLLIISIMILQHIWFMYLDVIQYHAAMENMAAKVSGDVISHYAVYLACIIFMYRVIGDLVGNVLSSQ